MGQVVLGLDYFRTLGGKLKLIQLVLNIIAACLVCIGVTGDVRNFFLSAAIIGSIITIGILVLHLLKLLRTDPAKSEFLVNFIFFFYYLAACILIINSVKASQIYVQVLFGEIIAVFAAISYIVDAGYCFWQDPFCFKR